MIKRNKIGTCATSIGIMCISFLTPSIPPITMPSRASEIHEVMTSRDFRTGMFEVQQKSAHASWPNKLQKIDTASWAQSDWFQAAIKELQTRIKVRKELEGEQGLKATDDNWLTAICQHAAVGPKHDHSDISINLERFKPKPDDLRATLVEFKNRTLEELQQELNHDVQVFQKNYVSAYATAQAPGGSIEKLASIPHVRKLVVTPDTKICCSGDIHGSIGALARNMWMWRRLGLIDKGMVAKKNVYFVFLGDYVDYGKNSLLVLYTLLKFKLRNWDSVILLRGNHETASQCLNFDENLQSLYGGDAGTNFVTKCLANCFSLLPFALYIGTGAQQPFIQCCHGGIEPGYNPQEFLQSNAHYQSLTFDPYTLNDDILKAASNTPAQLKNELKEALLSTAPPIAQKREGSDHIKINPSCSGFLWSDFRPNDPTHVPPFTFNFGRGSGFMTNQDVATTIGTICDVCAYIRGHQHNRGIKIGAINNDENARWFRVLGREITAPQNAAIIPQASFSLKFTAQTAQDAFTQALKDNDWQKFEQQLPLFALSDPKFGNNIPIVTLTTASEAPKITKLDAFCLCTINKNIKESTIAIYEAEAAIQKSTQQQAPQETKQESATPSKTGAHIIKKIEDVNPLAWLQEMYMLAAIIPKHDHSGLVIDLTDLKPTPQDLAATLAAFSSKTLQDLQNDIQQFGAQSPQSEALTAALENFKEQQTDIYRPYAKESLSYVRKLMVQPGDKIYFVGDIHGSIGALVRNMHIWRQIGLLDATFRIAKGNYLVCLGDYVDYGQHSFLTLYTLIKLKLLNWDSVVLLKGNHELELDDNPYNFVQHMRSLYGDMKSLNYLKALLGSKFPEGVQDAGQGFYNICIINCFNVLPFALYVGLGAQQPFIHCCHGGIEPGYQPKAFLEGKANYQNFIFNPYTLQKDILEAVSVTPDALKSTLEKALMYKKIPSAEIIDATHIKLTDPSRAGFFWSDFYKVPGLILNPKRNIGFSADQATTTKIAQACNLCAYIRGHQHHLGIKFGDINLEGDGDKEARWANIFPDKAGAPSAQPIEAHDMPFALKFSAQSTQEGFVGPWEGFEQKFPVFSFFSDFANNAPIVTLTTASEAASIDNIWDSFCVVTIDPDIRKSQIRIYEAEAYPTREARSIITTILTIDKVQLQAQKQKVLSWIMTLPTTEYCILALGIFEKRLLASVPADQQSGIKFQCIADQIASLKQEIDDPDSELGKNLDKNKQKIAHIVWYITTKLHALSESTQQQRVTELLNQLEAIEASVTTKK